MIPQVIIKTFVIYKCKYITQVSSSYAGRNMLDTAGNYDFCKYTCLLFKKYLVYNFYRDYIFMKDVIEKQFEIKLGM